MIFFRFHKTYFLIFFPLYHVIKAKTFYEKDIPKNVETLLKKYIFRPQILSLSLLAKMTVEKINEWRGESRHLFFFLKAWKQCISVCQQKTITHSKLCWTTILIISARTRTVDTFFYEIGDNFKHCFFTTDGPHTTSSLLFYKVMLQKYERVEKCVTTYGP